MTYGSAHYWASEDLNTTGENVGITLDSMCDIIMANDVTSGNVVVFIPGDIEHGQKGHFALGEGGGGSAEIDASIYQVIVGDGEGNGVGAQGGAEAQEANKIYLKDKRLGPNIPTCEDDGTPIQDVDTGSFTIASNGLGHTHTETVHDDDLDEDVEVQVEDDGWKATIEDLAKVLATGKSKVEIGEKDADYNLTFWEDTLSGPDIKIKGAAKIEMLEKAVETDNPGITAISMRGNSLIDMSNEKVYDYDWKNRYFPNNSSARAEFRRLSPFANKNDGPILQLKGSPTVMFQDDAIVKVDNGSLIEVGGNARIHVVGGEWINNATPNAINGLEEKKIVNITAGPGFWSELYGKDDFYSVLNMNPGTLILTTQLLKNQIPTSGGGSIYSYQSCFYDSGYRDTYTPGYSFSSSDWNIFHLNRLAPSSYTSTSAPKYDNRRLRSRLASPTFSMSNATMLSVTATDESAVCLNIASASKGTIVTDISSNGHINIKAGIEQGASFVYDFGSDAGADAAIKVGFAGRSRMAFFPKDGTSIQFAPRGPFAFFANGKYTEMHWEWEKFYGLFAGHDVFAQVDGNSHFESWSGTVILRNSNNLRAYNGSDTSRHAYYPYFSSPGKNRSVNGTITVNADLSNTSIADIESTYANQLKSATTLNAAIQNDYTWTGFSGTSKSKLPARYYETLSCSSCTCVGTLPTVTLYGDYDTWDEIYASEEFKQWIKTNLGCTNTPTYNSVTGGEITRKQQYGDGRWNYTGTFPINITNITMTIESGHSTTPIDEAYSNFNLVYNGSSSYPGTVEMRNKIVTDFLSTKDYYLRQIFKLPSSPYFSYSSLTENQYEESISLEDITFNQTGGDYNYYISITTSSYINLNNTTVEQFLQNSQVLTSLRSTFCNFTTVEPLENVDLQYSRYQYSRYYYSIKGIKLHYDSWPMTNTFYSNSPSSGSMLNHPGEDLSSLDPATQNTIKNKIGTSYTSSSYGVWDWSNATFANNYTVTETVKYSVSTTSAYTGNTETHLGKNWYGPIQTADRVGDKDWDRSPIVQAYGPVNICVREKYLPGLEYNTTITTSENEFDLTDMNQAIRDFVASSHYQELLDYISNNYSGKELYYINRINTTASTTQYAVYFFLKEDDWDLEVASTTNVPVVDVTEGSELRIYGGAKIKAVTKYGETTYEFSSSDSDEEPVSFTLSELKALKQLLNNT